MPERAACKPCPALSGHGLGWLWAGSGPWMDVLTLILLCRVLYGYDGYYIWIDSQSGYNNTFAIYIGPLHRRKFCKICFVVVGLCVCTDRQTTPRPKRSLQHPYPASRPVPADARSPSAAYIETVEGAPSSQPHHSAQHPREMWFSRQRCSLASFHT
ncbi:hypothetical protein EDC01DRAFT_7910 [Geopyxis carbonaria]|nr:hypothetical protein EDC01DRAFT_7910 [Geopyxis carbonaria]